MICTRRTSDWHGNAFRLSLIGYTSTCEIAVRNSDWLYRLFSHVKIKRIDLYKWALWNKNSRVMCNKNFFLILDVKKRYRATKTALALCSMLVTFLPAEVMFVKSRYHAPGLAPKILQHYPDTKLIHLKTVTECHTRFCKKIPEKMFTLLKK